MRISRKNNPIYAASLAALVFVAAALFHTAEAATESEIRAKIAENNRKIEDIQRQIDQYSSLLDSTSKQAQTLKNTLAQLELTRKKLENNLALTTAKISKTTLSLEALSKEIARTEGEIGSKSEAVAEGMREMAMAESESAVEELLKNKSISETWDYVNSLRTLQGRVADELEDLRDLRSTLAAKRDETAAEKARLVVLEKNLADERKVVESTKSRQSKLLTDTQSKESNYKAILAEQIRQKDEFERELFRYESELKIAIDPSAIPGARSGLLSWPLAKVSVTQYFGYTAAAAKLYKTTQKHGGVDFRASIGAEVKAALSGIVTDTEAVKFKSGCQYGKYVLIRHPNGLSTIYGHLSVVSVKPGDTVITGDKIGHSGDTGYATGPHLHFGLYATQGVRVVDASSLGSKNCTGIKTVAATPAAYLDPMAYLPSL